MGAIGATAGGLGAVPGNPYGWAFGLGAAAANALNAAVNNGNGITQRMSVQQTIATDAFLELTNGRTWIVRQSGDYKGGILNLETITWDWELDIQAWGCSVPDGSTIPPN